MPHDAAREIDRAEAMLLAVDLGVRTGLALYDQDGRLRWYRSQNFGTAARLRRGAHTLLGEIPHLRWLVLEGGGPLAEIWKRAAEHRRVLVRQISAEIWRRQFLYAREQRNGATAKDAAATVARAIIVWSQVRRPTSLRDDTAEAILIGLWGVLDVGWLAHVPAGIRHSW